MKKSLVYLLVVGSLLGAGFAQADEKELPEVFQGFTWNSQITISYDDLDALLDATVLDVGMSDRSSAKSSSTIGTRMRSSKNSDTAFEANRFIFEELKKSTVKDAFHDIRVSLEQVPSEIAMSELKTQEQLAYWLNLYNIALLETLISEYPIHDMEDELTGTDSILDRKFLNVAGHSLSLNDIQHNIVYKKFGDKPIVMYGFYQGNIGSPSLNPEPYTGDRVYHQLEHRAEEFINSNRGVVPAKKNTLEVSRFYEQSKALFANFDNDLKKHLSVFANADIRSDVKQAKRINTDIENWSITDIYGTARTYGAGAATNNAAMLDSVVSNSSKPIGGEGSGSGIGATNLSALSDQIASRTVNFGRFTPEQLELVQKLNMARKENLGTVEISDLPTKSDESKN
ncbi:DUF547 domain-containing protein [Pseudoalteromonas sp. BDTF-M6]|uniref:DUF547 domain-containing protein n=1 Tax=Pseudoalteromonas sp. BDTF-M6 TaxID=2796132 RepID=UPI001BB0A682|nr:DUF547 domain-containing protein [Pseudoalteromonas sp. BDTF-M6]MBS3798636.1 DUF547 domain-containing protein [Pseudoalteromonas sp. BDTF-M6]